MTSARPASLVTGAGRRVGRVVALALADAGHDVVIHYHHSAGAAAETVAEAERRGARALLLEADLASPQAVRRLVDAAAEALGRLDHVVSSASTLHKRKTLALSVADWDASLAVNLRAPFLLAQAAAQLFSKQTPLARAAPSSTEEAIRGTSDEARGDGRVVAPSVTFITDGSALAPWPGYLAHGTARAGLLYLTQALALELAPHARVNAIVAGPVLPPDGMDPTGPVWMRVAGSVPLGTTGRPEDVAGAVLYLVNSPYVTGAVLPVDGGQHLTGRGG